MDNGVPVARVTRATPVLPAGVTDDTPDLDRQQVSLDIPSELFGSSADMTLRISEVFGQLIQVGSCLVVLNGNSCVETILKRF